MCSCFRIKWILKLISPQEVYVSRLLKQNEHFLINCDCFRAGVYRLLAGNAMGSDRDNDFPWQKPFVMDFSYREPFETNVNYLLEKNHFKIPSETWNTSGNGL